MELSRYEQETIINYNEAEKSASIYTHNRALRHKLERLTEERPDECRLIRTTRDGQAVEYEVPKEWMKITPKRILSEEEKAKRREAVKKLNVSRQSTSSIVVSPPRGVRGYRDMPPPPRIAEATAVQ